MILMFSTPQTREAAFKAIEAFETSHCVLSDRFHTRVTSLVGGRFKDREVANARNKGRAR